MAALTLSRRLLAALAAALALALGPWLAPLDERLADFLAPLGYRDAPPQLLLIDLDEASLAAVGPWPWPRATLARLAAELRRLGVAHQYWDFFLPEPRPGDDTLAAALGPDLTLGVVAVLDPRVDPAPLVGELPSNLPPCTAEPPARGHLALAPALAAAQPPVGHLTPLFDPDGRLRRLPGPLCLAGRAVPPLAYAPPARAGLAPAPVLRLPLLVPPERLPALPAALILAGTLPNGALAGKLVLVGATALGAGDRVPTAFGPATPGLAVHAQLLAGQLLGHLPADPTPSGRALLALAWLLLAALLARPLPLLAALPLPLLAHLAALHFAALWLPPLTPALALAAAAATLAAAAYLRERRARLRLAAQLHSLLPEELARRLIDEIPPEGLDLRPGTYTLLFVRLRNLDAYERLAPPSDTALVLHTLLAAARPIATRHGADLYPAAHLEELLVAWPAPPSALGPRPAQAAAELHAALTQALAALPIPEDAPPLAVSLAATAGPAFSGFVGGRDKRRPLLTGPAVRRARELACLAPELAAAVLLDDTLAAALPPAELLPLGLYLLPDAPSPSPLYALRGVCDPLPA